MTDIPAVSFMLKSIRDSFAENRRGICKFRQWSGSWRHCLVSSCFLRDLLTFCFSFVSYVIKAIKKIIKLWASRGQMTCKIMDFSALERKFILWSSIHVISLIFLVNTNCLKLSTLLPISTTVYSGWYAGFYGMRNYWLICIVSRLSY